ncbi:MAG: hypothetical protein Kow0068_02690 [Marinilabiliales bacterium]
MLYLNYKPTNQTPKQILQHFYKPQITDKTIEKKLNEELVLLKIIELYNNKKYDEAYMKLVAENTDNVKNDSLNYIYGKLLMQRQDYSGAINAFTYLINDKENVYYLDSLYCRGICYIQTKNYELAKKDFEILQNNSKNNNTNVFELIEIINSLVKSESVKKHFI